jgi:hypothetical protein
MPTRLLLCSEGPGLLLLLRWFISCRCLRRMLRLPLSCCPDMLLLLVLLLLPLTRCCSTPGCLPTSWAACCRGRRPLPSRHQQHCSLSLGPCCCVAQPSLYTCRCVGGSCGPGGRLSASVCGWKLRVEAAGPGGVSVPPMSRSSAACSLGSRQGVCCC